LISAKTHRLSNSIKPFDLELSNLRSERFVQLNEPFLSESDETVHSLVIEDNPRKAVFYFVLSSVLMTVN